MLQLSPQYAVTSPGDLPDPGETDLRPHAHEADLLATQAKLTALELEMKQEELREVRSRRLWTAITGLVGVGALFVSVAALKRS